VAATPDGSSSYIRAGGGVDVRGGRVAAIVAVSCAIVLAAVAVALAVGAAHRNARFAALRHNGVPVTATVTGCLAISSGVGMGIEYWQCRGDYTVAGRTYNEVIGGSRQLLERGQTVDAVASSAHPTVVATAAAVSKAGTSGTSYAVPVVLGAAAVALVAGWLVLSRRSRRRRLHPPS
jgi:hypothetical protein